MKCRTSYTYKLKRNLQIESAAIYSKVQEGDATMLIQGSIAWTKNIKSIEFSLRLVRSS